jgi:hypothetical protein
MKGYKLDRTLYIFDATPDAIPVSVDDVDVIYVQQELLAAYVNANQDVASKIKPYNYKLLAVNKLPWADYIDNDLVEETTEYTVNVNFGQTLLETLPDGSDNLPFEPSMPYTAAEGTQLVFTLPFQSDWEPYREGNTDLEHKIQIQVPESIQDSYEIIWPYEDGEDPYAPVQVDGTLSFTMPAENVTLNIDLVENPDYVAPPVETELTVVNNLPEGWTCEVAILSEGNEEPVPVEDINSNITLYENDEVFVKVLNENNEPVNYFNEADGFSNSYSWTHESAETMRMLNVYCSIEGDFNDEITTDNLGYNIWGKTVAADNFGYGENFTMPSIPLTLTIQKS